MKPNFKNIDIYAGFQPQNGMEWQKENGITADWKTPEHINVKPVYTKEDLEGMEHLNYVAGIPPYLRGPYSMMYTFRPWTIRQYAGFSTAEKAFKDAKVPLVTLTNYEAVMEVALRTGYIEEEDVETLNEWRKDPAHWESGK